MNHTPPKPSTQQPTTLLLEVKVIPAPRDRGYLANKNGNNKI